MEPIRRPDTERLIHAVKFRLKATPLDANHVAEVVLEMFEEVITQLERQLAQLEERIARLESR